MPEARQNSSKLAEMFDRASSFNALVGMAVDVVSLFMALLSSVESAPRAYRLKASNAASPFSTSIGTIPGSRHHRGMDHIEGIVDCFELVTHSFDVAIPTCRSTPRRVAGGPS